jgi:hypothetical protein
MRTKLKEIKDQDYRFNDEIKKIYNKQKLWIKIRNQNIEVKYEIT